MQVVDRQVITLEIPFCSQSHGHLWSPWHALASNLEWKIVHSNFKKPDGLKMTMKGRASGGTSTRMYMPGAVPAVLPYAPRRQQPVNDAERRRKTPAAAARPGGACLPRHFRVQGHPFFQEQTKVGGSNFFYFPLPLFFLPFGGGQGSLLLWGVDFPLTIKFYF